MQGRNVPTILRIPSFAVVVVVVVEIITIIVRTLSHVAHSESVKFRLAVLVIYGNCLLRAEKNRCRCKTSSQLTQLNQLVDYTPRNTGQGAVRFGPVGAESASAMPKLRNLTIQRAINNNRLK